MQIAERSREEEEAIGGAGTDLRPAGLGWQAPGLQPMPREMRLQVRGRVHSMIMHSWDSYMEHAFPLDELAPISCKGQPFSSF